MRPVIIYQKTRVDCGVATALMVIRALGYSLSYKDAFDRLNVESMIPGEIVDGVTHPSLWSLIADTCHIPKRIEVPLPNVLMIHLNYEELHWSVVVMSSGKFTVYCPTNGVVRHTMEDIANGELYALYPFSGSYLAAWAEGVRAMSITVMGYLKFKLSHNSV